MRNITAIGKSSRLKPYQLIKPRPWPRCPSTMELRLKLPVHSTTVTMMKPIETSYEIICADARSAEKNGYFEFDAQPAITTPYTPSELTARM